MAKTNDWIATLINNEDQISSIADIAAHGITPDNTTIQSEDYYKNIDAVQKKFTDPNTGKFDENKFDNFYSSALSEYNSYSNGEFQKDFINSLGKDKYDWTDPFDTNRRNYTATMQVGYNPDRRNMGIGNIFEVGGPSFSMREVAQANSVRDENGNILDWSPNDKGGLFKSLTRPTLALATWDEDGTHEINGVRVTHKKGEYKYDENGDPYYEILKNKEAYDKDILHWTDTITVDGSKLNSVDIFDADGLKQSAFKTVMKNTIKIAPLLIPGVGEVYGGIKAVTDLASVMPTVLKAANGVIGAPFGGNENGLGRALTAMENYVSRFDTSTSDASRDKFLTFENVGNIFGDSAGQLFSQRQIGKLAQTLDFGKDALATQKIGRRLSLGYMAITSSKESYSDFKQAGASDAVAGLGMFAIMGGLYGLMNTDYFRDFTFQDSYLGDQEVRSAVSALEKTTSKDLYGVLKAGNIASKEELAQAVSAVDESSKSSVGKFFNTIKNWTVKAFKNPTWQKGAQTFGQMSKDMWYGSINEATEEVMEEVASDATKALFSGLNLLGIRMTKDPDEQLDFGITLDDMAQRYAASFLGGFLGGATFQGLELYQNRNVKNHIWGNTDDETRKHILYLMTIGKGQDIVDLVTKRGIKNKNGDKNLSATKGRWITVPNVEGKSSQKWVWDHGTDSDNQNKAVTERMLADLNEYQNMIGNLGLMIKIGSTKEFMKNSKLFEEEADALGISKEELMAQKGENPLIQYIFNTGLDHSTLIDDVVDLNTRIVKNNLDIQELSSKLRKAEEDSEEISQSDSQKLKELKEEQKNLVKEREAYVNGEKNYLYGSQILFTVNEALQQILLSSSKDGVKKPFIGSNVQNFVKGVYNKNWKDLSEAEKADYKKEYDTYMADKGKDQIKDAFRIFEKFSVLSADGLNKFEAKYKDAKRNQFFVSEQTHTDENGNSFTTYERACDLQWWEVYKQALAEDEKELTTLNDKLVEAIASHNGDAEAIANDNNILAIKDRISELNTEMNKYKGEIQVVENNLSNALETSFSQYGLDEFADDFFARIGKIEDIFNQESDLTEDQQNELRETAAKEINSLLDDITKYYETLQSEQIISSSDRALTALLNTIGQVLADRYSNNFNVFNVVFATQYNPVSLFASAGVKFSEREDGEMSERDNEELSSIAIPASEIFNLIKEYYAAISNGNFEKLSNIQKEIEDLYRQEIKYSKWYKDNKEEVEKILPSFIEEMIYGDNIDIKKKLQHISDVKQTTLQSPLLDLLQGMNITVDKDVFDVLKLMEDERYSLKISGSPDQYIIDDKNRIKALEGIIDLLDSIQAVVEAAADGHNNAVNQLRGNKGPLYGELSVNTAQMVLEDIDFMKNKINELLKLSKENTKDAVTEQKKYEIDCLPKYASVFFQSPDKDPESDEIKATIPNYQIAKLIGSDKTCAEIFEEVKEEAGVTDFDWKNVTEANFEQARYLIHKFEEKLHTIAGANNVKFDADFGAVLVQMFGNNIWKQQENQIGEKDFEPTDYQKLCYVASVFGVDPGKFISKYKAVVEKSNFAPFYNQEIVVREVYAWKHNKDLYSGILNALKAQQDALLEDPNMDDDMKSYIKGKLLLDKCIFVDGGTGTGKTTAVASIVTSMDNSENLIVAAPVNILINKSDNDEEEPPLATLVKDPKQKFLVKELLKKGFKDYEKLIESHASKENVDEDHTKVFKEDDLKVLEESVQDISELFGDGVTIDQVKTLICDEGSLLNETELQALNILAKHNNIDIILLGDGDQNSNKEGDTPTGFFDCVGLKTTSLATTVRASNRAQLLNFQATHNAVLAIRKKIQEDPIKNDNTKATDALTDEFLKTGKIKLVHCYKDNDLYGMEVRSTDKVDYQRAIDDVIKFKNAKRIAIICDESSREKWEATNKPNNVEIVSADKVQGGEFDYVIIDHKFSSGDYLNMKDLYTLINRAKIGGIIYDQNSLSSLIDPQVDDFGDKSLTRDPSIWEEFKTWKLGILNKLTEGIKEEKDSLAVEEDGGTDLTDQDFQELRISAPEEAPEVVKQINREKTLKTLDEKGESEADDSNSDAKRVNRRNKALALEGSIDYEEFGNWCDKNLIKHESNSPFSIYKTTLADSDEETVNASARKFIDCVSGIILDNLNPEKPVSFGSTAYEKLFEEFRKNWSDPNLQREFYITKATEDAENGLLQFRLGNNLIPIAIIKISKPGKVLKYIFKGDQNPFKKEVATTFISGEQYLEGKNAPGKHVYFSTSYGIFSKPKDAVSLIYDGDPSDPETEARKKAKESYEGTKSSTGALGKTQVLVTHNRYYAETGLQDGFLYKEEKIKGVNRKTYYIRGANGAMDVSTPRTIHRAVSLKDLVEIVDVIQYIFGNNEKASLHVNLEVNGSKISSRTEAMKWLEEHLGTLPGLKNPWTQTDPKARQGIIRNNFKVLSGAGESVILTQQSTAKLLSAIYSIFKTDSEYNPSIFYDRFGAYFKRKDDIQLPIVDGHARTMRYGLKFTMGSNGHEAYYYAEYEYNPEGSKYNIYEWKNNTRGNLIESISAKGNENADFIEAIYKSISKNYIKNHEKSEKYIKNVAEDIKSGMFTFTLSKRINFHENEDYSSPLYGNVQYYNMNVYDLVYKCINCLGTKDNPLDISKLNTKLRGFKQFKGGIYLRDASQTYFANDSNKSAFKEFVPGSKIKGQYIIDSDIILAPVYSMEDPNSGEIIDETTTDAFDKAVLNIGGTGNLAKPKIIIKDSEMIIKKGNKYTFQTKKGVPCNGIMFRGDLTNIVNDPDEIKNDSYQVSEIDLDNNTITLDGHIFNLKPDTTWNDISNGMDITEVHSNISINTNNPGIVIFFNPDTNTFIDGDNNTLKVLGNKNGDLYLKKSDGNILILLNKDIETLNISTPQISGICIDNSVITTLDNNIYSVNGNEFTLDTIAFKGEGEINGQKVIQITVNGNDIFIPSSEPIAQKIITLNGKQAEKESITIESDKVICKLGANGKQDFLLNGVTVNSTWLKNHIPEFNLEGDEFILKELDLSNKMIIFANGKQFTWTSDLSTNNFGELTEYLNKPSTQDDYKLAKEELLKVLDNSDIYDTDFGKSIVEDSFNTADGDLEKAIELINEALDSNVEEYKIVYENSKFKLTKVENSQEKLAFKAAKDSGYTTDAKFEDCDIKTFKTKDEGVIYVINDEVAVKFNKGAGFKPVDIQSYLIAINAYNKYNAVKNDPDVTDQERSIANTAYNILDAALKNDNQMAMLSLKALKTLDPNAAKQLHTMVVNLITFMKNTNIDLGCKN